MANEIQFDFGGMNFGGMNFGDMNFGPDLEELLNQIEEMYAGFVDEIIKDEYRAQLKEAALASGGASDGVITERENELIEKAVNGTITSEEKDELLSYFPARYSDTSENPGDLSDLSSLSVDELIYLVSQPLSAESAAAATELRNRASVDGYVSSELNTLLNKARLNGGLTESEQLRMYQLLQEEDGL